MKGAIKGSPAASAEKSSSGKKLVQARLPFKILSTPVPAASSAENEPRKRKLSSDSDLPAPKVLCTSEIKENVSTCENSIVISDDDDNNKEGTSKEGNAALNPVVQLHNIDNFIKNSKDENGRIVLSPKTPNTSKNWSTPLGNKTSGKSNKFVIKLPLSNKKKRKLSEKLNASRSPERSGAENTPEHVKARKKPKTSPEDPSDDECDAVEIAEDEDTLSANICLQVTNMSENSVLESAALKKVPVEKCEGFLPEEAANDSELFSVIKEREKNKGTSEALNTSVGTQKGTEKDDITAKRSMKDELHKEAKNEEKSAADNNEEAENTSPNEEIASTTDVDSDDNENRSTTPLKGLDRTAKLQQKSLTPRQLQKLKEREEKLKQREEERLQRQKEKDEKERQRKKEREEKEEQRRKEKEEKEELKRKEKEEKEEQRRKEKEEKEKKRLAEIEAKNEERRKKEEIKEEERRKKEEEKRKKEQEKEEAENKKRKAAEVFTKFFVQSKLTKEAAEEDQNSMDSEKFKNSTFMPFQVKCDMKLAPLLRRALNCEAKTKLCEFLENSQKPVPSEDLYLSCLKSGKISPGKDSKTWLTDEYCTNDCLVIEDELEGAGQKIDDTIKPMQKYRAKYFYFHENQRPPYYGTWRKKSAFVKPRRPFATDTKHFDYENDSDDEWEEEEPGESLHGSDDEKESEDEYEVDNEFFVPHGHLSDEELQNEDELDNSPEMQKAKLKILQQEFAQEMKKKTEKIKPRLVGIVWQDENGNKPDLCSSVIWESLNKRAMIFSERPLMTEPEKKETEINSPIQEKKVPKKCQLTEEQIKDLIKLVHGNRHKREFILREFEAFMSQQTDAGTTPVEYTKASFKEQVDKIAEWGVIEDPEKKKKKCCWMVFPDTLKQFGMEDLTYVNRWEYILQPKRILHETKTAATPQPNVASTDKKESTLVKKKKKKKHIQTFLK